MPPDMPKPILKYAFINAAAATLYIAAIAAFLSHAEKIFGPDHGEKTALIPMFMLSLLVMSVAVMGSAVFGRSAMWYLDGKKREALALLGATLALLACATAIFGTLLVLLK